MRERNTTLISVVQPAAAKMPEPVRPSLTEYPIAAKARGAPAAAGVVGFGSRVTFDRDDGRRQTFRIVGEDEADARRGSVSYVSPLARALFGRRIGDVAALAGGEVEIVAIE